MSTTATKKLTKAELVKFLKPFGEEVSEYYLKHTINDNGTVNYNKMREAAYKLGSLLTPHEELRFADRLFTLTRNKKGN